MASEDRKVIFAGKIIKEELLQAKICLLMHFCVDDKGVSWAKEGIGFTSHVKA